MKVFTLLLIFGSVGAVSAANNHTILGSNQMGWNNGKARIVSQKTRNNLTIRHVRIKDRNCRSGYMDHLEMDGNIEENSSRLLEKMIKRLRTCKDRKGKEYSNTIYMNSPGGYIIEGIEMGTLIRQYEMTTRITRGQSCASSCAIAFMGGVYRYMDKRSEIMFHTPYIRQRNKIVCYKRQTTSTLRAYFIEMAGRKKGKKIFRNSVKYCDESKGWTPNYKRAAKYGITTK